MTLTDKLKEFFEKSGGTDLRFSDPRWGMDGRGVLYVDLHHPDHGKGRIRCGLNKKFGKEEIVSVTPLARFFENEAPWDSTIKSVATLYSGIAGVNGVANRTVNRSLI